MRHGGHAGRSNANRDTFAYVIPAIGQRTGGSRHNGRVRFEVSRVLDAIERRLTIDPVVASGVVDLTEVIRLGDLDGGRPANLLRLGLIVDALGQRLGDSAAAMYAVADRGLISDTELTSNERMVIRRWSDDGLIEVLPAGTPVQPRIREISALTGLAMITRVGGAPRRTRRSRRRAASRSRRMRVSLPVTTPGPTRSSTRQWLCPELDCPSFGPHARGPAAADHARRRADLPPARHPAWPTPVRGRWPGRWRRASTGWSGSASR